VCCSVCVAGVLFEYPLNIMHNKPPSVIYGRTHWGPFLNPFNASYMYENQSKVDQTAYRQASYRLDRLFGSS
jgi:hypothetical protein